MAGLYFEEFQVGQVFDHAIRRTLTETDNVLFSTMTHNPAPLHLDEEYCRKETEFGQRIVNSCLTLSLMVGISVNDTTLGTTVANLGWEELRDSRSRPLNGIVIFEHRAFNQNDELVGVCKRSALMLRKPQE